MRSIRLRWIVTTIDMRKWFDRPWRAQAFVSDRTRRVFASWELPAFPGIYCLAIWRGGEWRVVYVGKGRNVRGRLQSHASYGWGSRSRSVVTAWIEDVEESGGVPAIWTRAITQSSERARIEIEAIHELRPWANVADTEPDLRIIASDTKPWLDKVEF